MRIIKIGYERKSAKIQEKAYLEAELEPWEDPKQSIQMLKQKVAEALGEKPPEIKSLEEEESELKQSIYDLRQNINWAFSALRDLKKNHQKAMKILEVNGIDTRNIGFPHVRSYDAKTLKEVKDDEECDNLIEL